MTNRQTTGPDTDLELVTIDVSNHATGDIIGPILPNDSEIWGLQLVRTTTRFLPALGLLFGKQTARARPLFGKGHLELLTKPFYGSLFIQVLAPLGSPTYVATLNQSPTRSPQLCLLTFRIAHTQAAAALLPNFPTDDPWDTAIGMEQSMSQTATDGAHTPGIFLAALPPSNKFLAQAKVTSALVTSDTAGKIIMGVTTFRVGDFPGLTRGIAMRPFAIPEAGSGNGITAPLADGQGLFGIGGLAGASLPGAGSFGKSMVVPANSPMELNLQDELPADGAVSTNPTDVGTQIGAAYGIWGPLGSTLTVAYEWLEQILSYADF